jgi:hypothetical protein
VEQKINIQLYLDVRENGVFNHNNQTIVSANPTEYYVTVPLYKTFDGHEDYVNIYIDPSKVIMPRQQFNPFFIELGFFNSIRGITDNGKYGKKSEIVEEKVKFFDIKINK